MRDVAGQLVAATALQALTDENTALRKSQAANEAELRRADETIGALRKRVEELNRSNAAHRREHHAALARAEKAEAILRGAICPGCDGSGTISREQPGDAECPYSCKGDSFAQVLARAEAAETERGYEQERNRLNVQQWSEENAKLQADLDARQQKWAEAVASLNVERLKNTGLQADLDALRATSAELDADRLRKHEELHRVKADLDAALNWIEHDEDESIPPAGLWQRVKALLEKRRVERG